MNIPANQQQARRMQLLPLLKWVWLLACLVVIVGLMHTYGEQAMSHLRGVSWWQFALSITALLAGKFLLAAAAQRATATQGWKPAWGDMLAMTSLSQLGKYIPGGIWQFLGRATLYADRGLTTRHIANALVLENMWQWGAASLVGTLLLLPFSFDIAPHQWLVAILLAMVAFALLWGGVFALSLRRLAPACSQSPWTILSVEALAWTCFGLSLWFLFPMPSSLPLLGVAISGFAAATVGGLLVPFAPAGIGVREVALVAILSRYMTAQEAAMYAGTSRLLWMGVEVGMATLMFHRARRSGLTLVGR